MESEVRHNPSVLALILILGSASWVCAQKGESGELGTWELGLDIAMAGAETAVLVRLTVKEPQIKVIKGILEIPFPNRQISFLRLLDGSALEGKTGIEKSVEVIQEPGEEDTSLLRLTISSKEGLPNGVLSNLVFHVSPHLTSGHTINLTSVKSTIIAEGGEELSLPLIEGVVTVITPENPNFSPEETVILGCFFYMH